MEYTQNGDNNLNLFFKIAFSLLLAGSPCATIRRPGGQCMRFMYHSQILSYFLFAAGNVGGAFAIDAFGNITVATKLDRETKAAYELTITAKDGAGIS